MPPINRREILKLASSISIATLASASPEATHAEPAAKRTGLDAQPAAYYLNASSVDETGKDAEAILYYFDYHQLIFYEFPLPAHDFTAEMIDPWNMTITPLPGGFNGKSKIRLSGRPYQAVRFRRVRTSNPCSPLPNPCSPLPIPYSLIPNPCIAHPSFWSTA